jgi:hypothetical protein
LWCVEEVTVSVGSVGGGGAAVVGEVVVVVVVGAVVVVVVDVAGVVAGVVVAAVDVVLVAGGVESEPLLSSRAPQMIKPISTTMSRAQPASAMGLRQPGTGSGASPSSA